MDFKILFIAFFSFHPRFVRPSCSGNTRDIYWACGTGDGREFTLQQISAPRVNSQVHLRQNMMNCLCIHHPITVRHLEGPTWGPIIRTSPLSMHFHPAQIIHQPRSTTIPTINHISHRRRKQKIQLGRAIIEQQVPQSSHNFLILLRIKLHVMTTWHEHRNRLRDPRFILMTEASITLIWICHQQLIQFTVNSNVFRNFRLSRRNQRQDRSIRVISGIISH